MASNGADDHVIPAFTGIDGFEMPALNGVDGSPVPGRAYFVLYLKSSPESLLKVYENAVTELPKLLPQVYKNITLDDTNPPTCTTEFAEGCPIKTQTEIVSADSKSMRSSYFVTKGDLMGYYYSFDYVQNLRGMSGGGTKVISEYSFYKKDDQVGPAIFEFFMANLIKLDDILNSS